MATVLGSYRDFGVFNVDVRTSPRFAILRFPTHLFHASPPGSAPGPRNHHPMTTTLSLCRGFGVCDTQCMHLRDSRLLKSRFFDGSRFLTCHLSSTDSCVAPRYIPACRSIAFRDSNMYEFHAFENSDSPIPDSPGSPNMHPK
jgi:hypothetical protein